MLHYSIKFALAILILQITVVFIVATAAKTLPHPEWDMLAFLPGNNPSPNVQLLDVDHRLIHPLPSVPGTHSSPSWSPDGRYLVYVVNDARIYLFDSVTYETRQLTPQEGRIRDDSPLWSPDSHKIIFQTFLNGFSIYEMDVQGENVQQLIANSRTIDFLTISPDGEKFAWLEYTNAESGYEIFISEGTNGTPQQLTSGSDTDIRFTPLHWSPDSQSLAFMFETSGLRWIGSIDVNGGEIQRLRRLDTYNAQPAWSLDGQKIAFWVADSPLQSTLFLMDSNGDNLRRIVTLTPQINFATWRR